MRGRTVSAVRILLLVLPPVLLVGAIYAYWASKTDPIGPPLSGDIRPARRRLRGPAPPPPPVLSVPPAEMRSFVEDEGLLRPDRRFVMAFEEVARRAGQESVTAKVSVSKRTWTIDVGLAKSAQLPAIPGFAETFDALLEVCRTVPAPKGGAPLPAAEAERIRALASDPFGDGPMQALTIIDGRWPAASGAERVALLGLASRAALTLNGSLVDSVGLADLVGGRALGLLALSETWSGKRSPERELLLGNWLGYPGEAKNLAATLHDGSLERLYLEGKTDELRLLAEKPSASRETRFLYLRSASGTAKVEDIMSFLARHLTDLPHSPQALLPELLLGDRSFERALQVNGELASRVAREVDVLSGRPEPGTGLGERGFLSRFERTLAGRPPLSGPFLDHETWSAYERALFYTGVYGIGIHYMDSLSSIPASQQFSASLDGADPGPGADFKRWYQLRLAVKTGQKNQADLLSAVTEPTTIGMGIWSWTATSALSQVEATLPVRVIAGEALRKEQDSRPAGDWNYSDFCKSVLHDPAGADAYYQAWSQRTLRSSGVEVAWNAFQRRDVTALRSLATDATTNAWPRVTAVRYLVQLDAISDQELRPLCLEIFKQGGGYSADAMTIRTLRDHGFLDEAEGLVRGWLRAHLDAEVLTRASYASWLQHILFLKGRYQESWDAIAPYVDTWKSEALLSGAEAREGLSQRQEADKLASAAMERYPDGTSTRLVVARLRWRQKRYEDAAKILTQSRYPIGPREWSDDVARHFHEVFRGAEPAETRKAFDELLKAGVNPWFLFEFPPYFARQKQYAVAWDLLDAISKKFGETIDAHLLAYRYRRLGSGREAADAWLQKVVLGSKSAGWVPSFAFHEREFDILWLVPDSDSVWRLRSWGAAFEGGATGERRARLEARLADPKALKDDVLYGRFLLGLETDERLLEAATDAVHRSDVAFHLGLKAISQKKPTEAAGWLRVCLQAAPGRETANQAEKTLTWWDPHRFGVPGGADLR